MVKLKYATRCALLVVLCVSAMRGQTGILSGKINDEQTGEEIVGANVLVVGTALGATTDIEGKYQIRNVPAGVHNVRISFVGYATKVVSGVTVMANETLVLNVAIASAAVQADEVVVTAERVLATESALLAERRKSSTIGDGVSIEQVKRTPDATSGDALKRVTGIAIVDNKFVFIRGITDRYNSTTLDGAAITSTEAGKKGFSFDLLPANLIENTMVVKSQSPDMPADFTGGLVQLNTLDFPDRQSIRLSLSASYNDLTTTKDLAASQGSRSWFGFDDGGRALPAYPGDMTKFAQSLPNTWAPRKITASPNTSFSLAYGDRYSLSDESDDQLGFVGAYTQRNSYQRNERQVHDRDLSRTSIGPRDDYALLWGALANVSYKFGGSNKISWKNSYNHSAEDQVGQFAMRDENNGQDLQFTTINYSQRSQYNGQLAGEHTFPSLGALSLQWRGSVSSSARQDPDRKEAVYYRVLDDPSSPYTVGYNKRSWSWLNDRTLGGSIDFSLPLTSLGKVKWGVLTEGRKTNYNIRYFRGTPDYFGGIPDSLTQLPLAHVYSPQNYGPGKFLFAETSLPSDSYEGEQTLYAGYLMTDLPFEILEENFRFAGGARVENWSQTVIVPKTMTPGGPVTRNLYKVVDVLPSFNLTYLVRDDMNVRVAYSHSVNRPEFRERAPVIFEDFLRNEIVGGNLDLARAYVRNYDVRFEFFPNVGEVLALSYFEKHISGAIEEQLLFSGTRTRVYFNSGNTKNAGWELEFRTSLDFLGGYLKNFSITGNYTRITSRVEYQLTTGNSSNTQIVQASRPMQGQSPYMINLSLLFTEPTVGTTVSLLYNKFGRRLNTVGFNAADIYEEAREAVDVALIQPIIQGLEGKFTIKNLTGKDKVLTRDDFPYERINAGTTYSLQLSKAF